MRCRAVLLVCLVSVAHAEDGAAPPNRFQDLAASVTEVGFHLDDRDPDGWRVDTICRSAEAKASRACKLLDGSWHSIVVADKRDGDEAVVQDLWGLKYGSTRDARRALSSLDKEFEWGPFGKRPYRAYRCGSLVIAVESRARWHTARKQLSAHVEAWIDEHC